MVCEYIVEEIRRILQTYHRQSFIENIGSNSAFKPTLMESLILAQDECWRRA